MIFRNFFIGIIFTLAGGLFLFFLGGEEIDITQEDIAAYRALSYQEDSIELPDYEATIALSAIDEPLTVFGPTSASVWDIENQEPLANPPKNIKAIYSTSWSASSRSRLNYFFELLESTELNAIVIDIKDFSGYVTYDSDLDVVYQYGAEQIRTPRINTLLKEFHDRGIYVIARLSVFQDPVLAKARPDLAVHSSSTGGVWYDRKGLAWTDPSSREVWDYNIAIAREAAERGFDEINFDYIRFPSDGDLSDMVFPHWDETTYKTTVMRGFFKYLNEQMKDSGAAISADLFGLTTTHRGGLGIGQNLEDVLPYVDYIAPMVYPSHYAKTFLGFANPAEYPYEVVEYSSDRAMARVLKLLMPEGASDVIDPEPNDTQVIDISEKNSDDNPQSNGEASDQGNDIAAIQHELLRKYRPWLQDFDLGADYDTVRVRGQIQAVYDALCKNMGYDPPQRIAQIGSNDGTSSSGPKFATSSEGYQFSASMDSPCNYEVGWMLWNPSNIYTQEALKRSE